MNTFVTPGTIWMVWLVAPKGLKREKKILLGKSQLQPNSGMWPLHLAQSLIDDLKHSASRLPQTPSSFSHTPLASANAYSSYIPACPLTNLHTPDKLDPTNSYTLPNSNLFILLLSFSLSLPRPTMPSRLTARQIPSVTSRTDDVQGACTIRMSISVVLRTWK